MTRKNTIHDKNITNRDFFFVRNGPYKRPPWIPLGWEVHLWGPGNCHGPLLDRRKGVDVDVCYRGGDHVDETLAGVGNKPERTGNFARQHLQNKETTSKNIVAAPASCHVLVFRFVESAEMARTSTLVAYSCPRIGRPLRPTAAALRTRPAVALRTRPAVDLQTRPVEALRPATTVLGTTSPGGADVARLPAVAAAVLQGAAVVAVANPVEVAADQPVVMLSGSRL